MVLPGSAPGGGRRDVLALIPAAGRARRLPGLECSKEIVLVGAVSDGLDGTRPKAVCEYLIEDLARAGVSCGLVILRAGKSDIPAYLDGLGELPLDLAYLTLEHSPSVPHTLDRAYRHLNNRRVALGFPDILIRPRGAFAAVLDRQESTGADLVLGLFPTRHPERADMVELDGAGRLERLRIKESGLGLRYAWSIAVWTPAFSRFLHSWLERQKEPARGHEAYVGDAIQEALDRGMHAEAVPFPQGDSLDIGEPEALEQARQELGGSPGPAQVGPCR